MTPKEKSQHPSVVGKRLVDLWVLSESLEPVFQAVEAGVLVPINEPEMLLPLPFTAIQLKDLADNIENYRSSNQNAEATAYLYRFAKHVLGTALDHAVRLAQPPKEFV